MEGEEIVKPKRKYTRKAVTQNEPVPPSPKPKKESARKPKAKSFLESLADRDFSQVEVLPVQRPQSSKPQPVITRKAVASKERPVAEVKKEVFTEDLEEEAFEVGEKEALVQDFYRPKHVSPEISQEQVYSEVIKTVKVQDLEIYEPEEIEMVEEEVLEEAPIVRPQTFPKTQVLRSEVPQKQVVPTKVKNSEEALNFNFKFSFNYKKYTRILIGLLILGLISWLLYYFIFSKTPDPLENLQKIVILPSETPVIYVISENADVLKNPVFAQARAGDRVFVFEKTALMVIFRESEDKIVDMVRFSGEQAQAQTNTQPTAATTTESTVVKPKVTAPSTASTTATTTSKTKKTN
jgi:hypothetical protein